MSDNPFYRLAPFIQEYIYRAGWDELRGVQVKAIGAILDTPNHVLITSATASGKTEAAFLPILTDLDANPSSTIGVMYVGPLKALINDQFQRLRGLLEETHIPVQSWHGDVDQASKQRFIKRATGVLQITPESLEAMLIKRHSDLHRLFGDLRYVVIDEAHAFIDSERGRQVICQLQRLSRYQERPARRIGLSATIGDPQLAADWLSGGSDLPVEIVDDTTGKRGIELGLEHFPDYRHLLRKLDNPDTRPERLQELHQKQQQFYDHVYAMINRELKTLVFANSRQDTEEIGLQLRNIAEQNRQRDIYYVHHGAISAPLREAAEDAMRDSTLPATTIATLTLELGIDIGHLDQVLQVGASNTVSSFLQRLGRSGRRAGHPSRMFFYSREQAGDPHPPLGRQIPWDMLQTIAIVQLYLEEKWIEPPTQKHLPLSLLYHQTMSTIASLNELNAPELAERILTLAPFKEVTPDQFRLLLQHLLEIRHLEKTEINSLILGLEGAKIVGGYWFYATFQDEEMFQVREASREIGFIQTAAEQGDYVRLAGYIWRVLEVNIDKRILFVERAHGRAETAWSGSGRSLHGRIVNRVRRVLSEDVVYPYLQERARERLAEARTLARRTGMTEQSILSLGGNQYMILPWCDSRTFATLELILDNLLLLGDSISPYYIQVKINDPSRSGDPALLRERLRNVLANPPTGETIAATLPPYALYAEKFDRYVPEALLRQAVARDQFDTADAIAALGHLSR